MRCRSSIFALVLPFALGLATAAHAEDITTEGHTADGQPCRVLRSATTDTGSGGLSTHVTAGGGKVSATTSGPGAVNAKAVAFGDGDMKKISGTSVTSTGAGSTVVVSSGGQDCIIRIDNND